MAIAVATTRQALADQYKTSGGVYVGTATADPGTTATPSSESTGGGYARVATTWTSSSGGTINGSACNISVPASTITYVLLATAASGNNMTDKSAVTSTVFSSAGTAVVTPTFSIT